MQNNDSTPAYTIKVTLVEKQENRRVNIPRLSFNVLETKLRSLIGLASHLYYIDEEGDKISITTDEELACAFNGGYFLHVFAQAVQPKSPTVDIPAQAGGGGLHESETIPVTNLGDEQPKFKLANEVIEPVLAQLEEKGFGGGQWKTHRNRYLLNKFGGDVAQVEAFLIAKRKQREERSAEREQMGEFASHFPGGFKHWKRHGGRHRHYHESSSDEGEQFKPWKMHRCEARRARARETIDLALQLMQLEEKGFGGTEWKRRRNARLIIWCGGDMNQVEALLEAKKNRPPVEIPTEFAAAMAQLEEKGYGENEWKKRRILRLLRWFDGDVNVVEKFLEAKKKHHEGKWKQWGGHHWKRHHHRF